MLIPKPILAAFFAFFDGALLAVLVCMVIVIPHPEPWVLGLFSWIAIHLMSLIIWLDTL